MGCKKKNYFMVEDELERIKLKKIREMFRRKDLKERSEPFQEQGKLAPSKPVDLTDTTPKGAVQNHPLVVVDCWAPWCQPCLYVSPIIKEIARDYAGKIFFGKLNVDKNRRTAVKYRIMSIPTLLVFKNGRLVDQIIGAMPRRMLEPKIMRYL